MPALVCLGMRWRTGSDDFVACGAVLSVLSFVVGAIGLIYLTASTSEITTDTLGQNHSVTVYPCAAVVLINETATSLPRPTELVGGLESFFKDILLAQSAVFVVLGVLNSLLAMFSSIGAIMETKRREPAVPVALLLIAAASTALLVLGALIEKRIHIDDDLEICDLLKNVGGFHANQIYYISHALAAVGFAQFSLWFLFFCMAFDGSRGKELSTRDSYHALWLFRLKILCFCFGWRASNKNKEFSPLSPTANPNTFRGEGGILNGIGNRGAATSGFDAFTDAADALAVVFEGLDLVPSDIAAGLLLLQGIQERRHRLEVADRVCYRSSRNPNGLALHRTNNGNYAEPPLSAQGEIVASSPSTNPVPPCGAFDRVSRQAQPFEPLSQPLVADLRFIERYSNYFLGAYGWKLFIFGRLASGLPNLCSHRPCFCCGGYAAPGRDTDCCGCDGNAMTRYTGLNDDEILLASFKNEVFLPAFYVALEHVHTPEPGEVLSIIAARDKSRKAAQTSSSVRGNAGGKGSTAINAVAVTGADFSPSMCIADDDDRAVIIAIRGSMSLEDCITDANAVPAPLHKVGVGYTGPLPAYCHGGMLRCAERILSELEMSGLLKDLVGAESNNVDGYSPASPAAPPTDTSRIDTNQLSKRRIVVLGHSLGAGTAVILSIILRQRYPSLIPRLQCISYAPPGGLLSAELSEYTRSFVVGTFMGCDVIPRLAVHTLTELRSSMLHALAASRQGKASVLCQFLCPTKTEIIPEEEEVTIQAFTTHARLVAHSNMIRREGETSRNRQQPTSNPSPSSSGEAASSMVDMTTSHPGDLLISHKMYPPARLVHFVKATSVSYSVAGGTCTCDGSGTILCGSCCCPKEDVYYPTYTTPGALQEIICSPYMGLDHLPDRFYDTMHDCFIRLRSNHLTELVAEGGGAEGGGNRLPTSINSVPTTSPANNTPTPTIFRHQSLSRAEAAGVIARDKLSDVVVRRLPMTPTTTANQK